MKKFFAICSFVLLSVACTPIADTPSDVPDDTPPPEANLAPYEKELQGRNGPCLEVAHCEEGLLCVGGGGGSEGKCQIVCEADADCGNGFICRSESCQADCADMNEKCSESRVCCFYDENDDRLTDAVCGDDGEGSDRCLVEISDGVAVDDLEDSVNEEVKEDEDVVVDEVGMGEEIDESDSVEEGDTEENILEEESEEDVSDGIIPTEEIEEADTDTNKNDIVPPAEEPPIIE